MSNAAGATAWLEGWSMTVEKAIEDALKRDTASSAG
jgi:hypothetical protein